MRTQLGGLDGGEASFFVGQRTHIESIDPILCMFSGYDLVCFYSQSRCSLWLFVTHPLLLSDRVEGENGGV
jgi:hypothetical protein